MATSTHEEQLYRIFNNVNDWLKFAEAKNAMLIAFNSASIYGIAQALNLDCIKGQKFIEGYLMFVIVLLIFSTITALLSFVPKVKIITGSYYAPGNVPNVLFFEYLKTKSNVEIIQEVTGISPTIQAPYARIELDIAEQIKQNSIIASAKYSYFTIAVWITTVAYVTLPIAVIYFLYRYIR